MGTQRVTVDSRFQGSYEQGSTSGTGVTDIDEAFRGIRGGVGQRHSELFATHNIPEPQRAVIQCPHLITPVLPVAVFMVATHTGQGAI